jgi:hypothetical protein
MRDIEVGDEVVCTTASEAEREAVGEMVGNARIRPAAHLPGCSEAEQQISKGHGGEPLDLRNPLD